MLRWQQIENLFERTAETDAVRSYDQRAIHQDRMRAYRIEQRIVGKRWITKVEIVIRGSFLT